MLNTNEIVSQTLQKCKDDAFHGKRVLAFNAIVATIVAHCVYKLPLTRRRPTSYLRSYAFANLSQAPRDRAAVRHHGSGQMAWSPDPHQDHQDYRSRDY